MHACMQAAYAVMSRLIESISMSVVYSGYGTGCAIRSLMAVPWPRSWGAEVKEVWN